MANESLELFFSLFMALLIFVGFLVCIKNIICGEMIMIFGIVTLLLSSTGYIHMVFCIIIGLLAAAAFYLLSTRIKVMRYVFAFGVSIFVAGFVYYKLRYYFGLDLIWTIAISITTLVILLAMHFVSYNNIQEYDSLKNYVFGRKTIDPTPEITNNIYYHDEKNINVDISPEAKVGKDMSQSESDQFFQ